MKKTLLTLALIAGSAALSHAAVYYANGFETTNGFSVGSVVGQQGWTNSSTGTSNVVASSPTFTGVDTGSQSLSIDSLGPNTNGFLNVSLGSTLSGEDLYVSWLAQVTDGTFNSRLGFASSNSDVNQTTGMTFNMQRAFLAVDGVTDETSSSVFPSGFAYTAVWVMRLNWNGGSGVFDSADLWASSSAVPDPLVDPVTVSVSGLSYAGVSNFLIGYKNGDGFVDNLTISNDSSEILLSQIPEPTGAAMLMGAAGLMLALRLRRK